MFQGLVNVTNVALGSNVAGSVVSRHGFLDKIKEYHLPDISPETYRKAAHAQHNKV
jgi:hypothetical protein